VCQIITIKNCLSNSVCRAQPVQKCLAARPLGRTGLTICSIANKVAECFSNAFHKGQNAVRNEQVPLSMAGTSCLCETTTCKKNRNQKAWKKIDAPLLFVYMRICDIIPVMQVKCTYCHHMAARDGNQ
jgi:hypothetical protein